MSINKFSNPIIRGQVDLFSLPPTDTTIESSVYAEYKPIVNIQDTTSKIDFRIIGNSNQYLDLFDSFLYLKVKVVSSDGSNLPDDAEVSTSNLFLHSLFSQCDVSLNDNNVSSSNNCYMYKAYLETLLSFGKEYLHSQGPCSLFYQDINGGSLDKHNTGYVARKKHIAKSAPVELIDKLRIDLAAQYRYILNDTNLGISLTRAPDRFCLLYTHSGNPSDPHINPVVKFLDASLFIRKHSLFPSLALSHQKLLDSGHNAKYPIRKCETKFFTIPQGNQSFVEENV